MDFKSINYLETGTSIQKNAFKILTHLNIFEDFSNYNPLLVGTIPLDIQTSKSDLDIILQTNNVSELAQKIKLFFNTQTSFSLSIKDYTKHILVCNFIYNDFQIEIYSENKPTMLQMGYLHLIKEYEILQIKPDSFKQEIILLKKKGIKTEPAFAKLLNLTGNPYEVLYKLLAL